MKRFLSILICICIVFTGLAASAAGSEELGADFSITPIEQNKYTGKLKINITLPETTENATLLMVFYKDGKAEKITKFNASGSTSFSYTFTTYRSFTPDEIKLFLWESGRIVPLSMSQDALTGEVIAAANSKVLDLFDMVDDTTNHIRQFLMPDTIPEDVQIANFLTNIDTCAAKINEENLGEQYLLTYEYFMRTFESELESIKPLMNDEAVKQRLSTLYEFYIKEPYITIIDDMLGFFNISRNS